jgi:hypothetical protein
MMETWGAEVAKIVLFAYKPPFSASSNHAEKYAVDRQAKRMAGAVLHRPRMAPFVAMGCAAHSQICSGLEYSAHVIE